MKRINLVYFSAAGMTKSIVTAIAGKLGDEKAVYDLLHEPPEQTVTFGIDSPAVFAMPVYAGRIHPICTEMLAKFRGQSTPAVVIAVYGNREYDDALLELVNILKANGFIIVAAATFVAQHSIFPIVATGRPDQKDEEAIAVFGEQCVKAIETFTGNEKISVKGNFPYREPGTIPFRPSGNSKCNECGTCVKICPANAIAKGTPRITDEACCISCTACITVCPQKARNLDGQMYELAGKAFAEKNACRKEPEFFFT